MVPHSCPIWKPRFIKYNNDNLDDIASAVSDFDIDLKLSKGLKWPLI
jgi:hypothetical protein